ncbi:Trypanosomal VSG domain containing protein [Trypanosoma brucei equiperdum]|uniref:Trypanosomal VSG domain containing protein n=1 Tax=Trypanosoma brucei equiperdum TaxID=630700 RepID=A0A3L6KSH7_9TRYP|nr:Trypanosomal VSG domain containing protein [Trypanosoma brucei equiperdum]RHW67373.1 Trypanosomal VSG domain containing protein [Trypanosoma brucei equiperdum]RHW67397.1 Trypanosomal VSG domain containing protein [Trypanosoma brucei equiperdum]RHW67402.1 Trypanosomal VSG domain containing protein [Trypanosoma brucei equiperdum]
MASMGEGSSSGQSTPKKPPTPNPYAPITNDGQKAALHTIAEQLSAVADELNTQALLLQTKVQETDKTAATAAITSAVFGEATSPDDLTAGKFLGETANRAAACAAAAVGKSILGDFYCLCTGTGSGDTDCGSGYSSTNGATSITFGKTQLTSLTDTCPKANDAPITALEIATAIAEFSATLTRNAAGDDAKVTLGKTTNHGCGGGVGEICVTYAAHFTVNDKKDIEAIPWVIYLRTVKKKLLAMAQAATQHSAVTTQLLAVQRQMDVAYAAALQSRLQTNQKAAESPKAAQHESHTTHEKQNKCKAAIKKNSSRMRGY